MSWFDFVFSLLDQFLPDPVGTVVTVAIIVFGSALTLSLIVRHWVLRDTLFISAFRDSEGGEVSLANRLMKMMKEIRERFMSIFRDPIGDVPFRGASVADRLPKMMKEIREVHGESALKASGEVISLQPRRLTENIGTHVGSFFVGLSPIGPLLSLTDRVWPRLELVGTASLKGSTLRLRCDITRNKKNRGSPIDVEVNLDGADPELTLSEELAYKVVMELLAQEPIDPKHARASLHTEKWEALKAHTEALRLWQASASREKAATLTRWARYFFGGRPEATGVSAKQASASREKVSAKLKKSIEIDSDNALAHYNLAILTYLTQGTPATNELARTYFSKAAEVAKQSGHKPTQALAWMGVSRCYSQEVHRFGGTESAAKKAREAAETAEKLLPRDPRIMYGSAFAWHCTETLDDIKEGRAIYEEIIKKYPGKYVAVYNNLGYILMIGGERLEAQGKKDEAEVWWKQAEGFMKKTVAFKGRTPVGISYTRANLGNLHRLRGDYEGAEEYYQMALRDVPDYTDGLNEFARLYFDLGDMSQGLHYHERALRTLSEPTDDEDHQKLMLMRQVTDILRKIRGQKLESSAKAHPAAEQVAALYQHTSEAGAPVHIETWLERLSELLESDVVSSPR